MSNTQSKAQALAAALIAAGFDITLEDYNNHADVQDIVVDIAQDFRVDVQVQSHDIIVEALAVFLDREIGWDSTTVAADSYTTEYAAIQAVLTHRKDYQDEVQRVVAEERAYDEDMAAAGLTA